jgi:hypothetical protein
MESVMQVGGRFVQSLGLAAALFGLLGASQARAHISLEQAEPATHASRYGDSDIKATPCGRDGGTRGTNVYTYEPGQTITVNVKEFVPHSGYFRIAFDNDGDDSFEDPQSIDPVERACAQGETRCGQSDFYNNATVLPGLDNLEPHGGGTEIKTWSWQVTLPAVECDNCTLQIIQVMEDHGQYLLDNDVYHTCIDLVLARGASGDAGPPPGDGDGDGDGTVDDGTTDDGSTGDGSTGDGDGSGDGSDDSAGDSHGDDGASDDGPGASGGGSNGGCALRPATTTHEMLAAIGIGLIALGARRRKR